MTWFLASCLQRTHPKSSEKYEFKPEGKITSPKAYPKSQFIDTQYVYPITEGGHLIFNNSLPKGGLQYTSPTGVDYNYAVFWTSISNKTPQSVSVFINFPVNSIALSTSDNNVRLFIPNDEMSTDKESLFDYGFDRFDSLFEYSVLQPNTFHREIKTGSSASFYIVTFFDKGVEGPVRTGFSLDNQNLSYRINDLKIPSGKIVFSKSRQQK